jgi:Cys-Gly metallodipeptidase DUG1
MGEWLAKEMKRLQVEVKKIDIGTHVMDGQTIPLPPILLGSYGSDPTKKTILVYGHYDVQPALMSDGWTYEPFKLHEDEQGRLFARGASDDKGPVLAWLWVIEAHQKLGIEMPVNIKMCFEGMEENGSECLDDVIKDQADKHFSNVDCVCISDNCK